jgi:hypothetical protein
MILLTQPTPWSFLAVAPTHAMLLWRHFGQVEVSAVYSIGNLDDNGNFIENQNTNQYRTPEKNEGWTRPAVRLSDDMNIPGVQTAIANLLNAGVAPDPTNPVNTIVVPAKKAGEAKIADFDALFAFFVSELNGTVV